MWSVLRLIMLGNLSEKHDRCTFCVPNDDTLLPLKILKDAPSPAQDTICLQLIFCEFTACFQTYFKLIGANSLLFKFVPTFNFKGHTESRLQYRSIVTPCLNTMSIRLQRVCFRFAREVAYCIKINISPPPVICLFFSSAEVARASSLTSAIIIVCSKIIFTLSLFFACDREISQSEQHCIFRPMIRVFYNSAEADAGRSSTQLCGLFSTVINSSKQKD